MNISTWRSRTLLGGVLLLTLLVYWPGLGGGFFFDDFANIVANESLRIQELSVQELVAVSQSNHSGPLGRPVSVITFALNHYISGLDARWFKIVNLVLHLLTGIFLFLLTRGLVQVAFEDAREHLVLGPEGVAGVVTALWLLHPLHASTVLYVVQRMAILSALFVAVSLWLYLKGRVRQIKGRSGGFFLLLALVIFFPLAVFSKENGILFLLFALLLEWCILKFRLADEIRTARFRRLVLVAASGAVLAGVGYLLYHPELVMAGYANRDFTLSERLMTQARVIFFYAGLILLPMTNRMGIFHDDFPLSHSLLEPPTTLLSLVSLVVLVAVAVWIRRRRPLVAFGILFFLVGHLLESTVFPLENVFEHRNYLPSYGIILAACALLFSSGVAFSSKRVPLLIMGGFILVFAFGTFSRAVSWGSPLAFSMSEASHHPESPRAQYELGRTYAELVERDPAMLHLYPLAVIQMERSASLSRSFNDGLFRLLPFSYSHSGEIPEEWVDELIDRLSAGIFPANNVNMLNWLVNCEEGDDTCGLPVGLVERLLKAAFRNPRLAGRARSELLVVASKFYLFKMRNLDNALFLIASAVSSAPDDARYRIYLARLLVSLGRFEDAGSELQAAEKRDRLGAYRKEIEELRAHLSP